jgi:hypothetical protein
MMSTKWSAAANVIVTLLRLSNPKMFSAGGEALMLTVLARLTL